MRGNAAARIGRYCEWGLVCVTEGATMRRLGWGIGILMLGGGFVGCGGSAATVPSQAAPVVATVAPTAAAMATKVGPSLDPSVALAGFKAAGIPIGDVTVYTATSDPNALLGRPGQYMAKLNFLDTRLSRQTPGSIEVEDGGSVEVFGSPADAKARYDYVQAVTKGNPLITEYDELQGVVLLRLSHRLTPDQAIAYQRVLTAVVP